MHIIQHRDSWETNSISRTVLNINIKMYHFILTKELIRAHPRHIPLLLSTWRIYLATLSKFSLNHFRVSQQFMFLNLANALSTKNNSFFIIVCSNCHQSDSFWPSSYRFSLFINLNFIFYAELNVICSRYFLSITEIDPLTRIPISSDFSFRRV